MELYGNMPLIEHLETQEIQRIEDFVIVIDTSMSCKMGLVQKFLEETYGILSQSHVQIIALKEHKRRVKRRLFQRKGAISICKIDQPPQLVKSLFCQQCADILKCWAKICSAQPLELKLLHITLQLTRRLCSFRAIIWTWTCRPGR